MEKKILYLHSLLSRDKSGRMKQLEDLYGDSNVFCPDLEVKKYIAGATFIFIVYSGVWCVTLYFIIKEGNYFRFGVLAILSVLTGWLSQAIIGRGFSKMMTSRSLAIAEQSFWNFKPNIIVASSYGAVIALLMSTPKVPMVLIAPIQGVYSRYMKIKTKYSVASYPYVIIVHASKDIMVPLEDSIELVEDCEIGTTRLEIMQGHHPLSSLEKDDLRDLVEEAFYRGNLKQEPNFCCENDLKLIKVEH